MTIQEKIYLDYLNNYLTVERMSEAYNIPTKELLEVINKGKEIHETNMNIKIKQLINSNY